MADTRSDLLSVLLDQHQRIRDLLDQVAQRTGAARREAFDALVRLLAVHEAAEEQVLHPAARVRLPDGESVAEARIEEEDECKHVLADLDRLGPEHEDFDSRFARLREMLLLHAANEEQEEFPGVREHFGEEELLALGDALVAAEAIAPTHPHPSDPDTPPGNLLAGPAIAMADRARDLMRTALERARGKG